MRILYFVLIASLIVACNSNSPTNNSDNQTIEKSSDNDPGLNSEIEDKKWALVELVGEPFEISKDDTAYFTLNSHEKKINGRLGCNTFFGTYKIEEKQRITFSKMATTLMACHDSNTEETLQKVLQETDNFIVKDSVLYLRSGRANYLAGFRMEDRL